MIHILHILFTLALFAAAFAGAIYSKLPRKVRLFSFIYAGWSLAGQILALPLLLLTLLSLFYALSKTQLSPIIAIINGATFILFIIILRYEWLGSKSLTNILPDESGLDLRRFIIGALFPFQLPRRDVKRLKNISYGPAGKRNQLDIYIPKTKPSTAMPVLIHVHGGGWVVGRKHQQAKPLIGHMASKGWLVVDINYRLAPRNKMPAMIEDVLQAVAWVKANVTSYGGDQNFVALTGGSAGGHLVALAALASGLAALKPGFEKADCRVDACVPVYGVYDFLDRKAAMSDGIEELQSFLAMLVMPGPVEQDKALWDRVSPMSHMHGDAPPMLILHGRHDALADFDSAQVFAKTLSQVSSNKVIFAALPSGQHAYDIAYAPPTSEHVRAVYRFLESARKQKTKTQR
jgi:acetyl esterase/lipase